MDLRVIKEVMCTELGAFLSEWSVTQRSRKTHSPALGRQEGRTEAGVGGKKMTKMTFLLLFLPLELKELQNFFSC